MSGNDENFTVTLYGNPDEELREDDMESEPSSPVATDQSFAEDNGCGQPKRKRSDESEKTEETPSFVNLFFGAYKTKKLKNEIKREPEPEPDTGSETEGELAPVPDPESDLEMEGATINKAIDLTEEEEPITIKTEKPMMQQMPPLENHDNTYVWDLPEFDKKAEALGWVVLSPNCQFGSKNSSPIVSPECQNLIGLIKTSAKLQENIRNLFYALDQRDVEMAAYYANRLYIWQYGCRDDWFAIINPKIKSEVVRSADETFPGLACGSPQGLIWLCFLAILKGEKYSHTLIEQLKTEYERMTNTHESRRCTIYRCLLLVCLRKSVCKPIDQMTEEQKTIVLQDPYSKPVGGAKTAQMKRAKKALSAKKFCVKMNLDQCMISWGCQIRGEPIPIWEKEPAKEKPAKTPKEPKPAKEPKLPKLVKSAKEPKAAKAPKAPKKDPMEDIKIENLAGNPLVETEEYKILVIRPRKSPSDPLVVVNTNPLLERITYMGPYAKISDMKNFFGACEILKTTTTHVLLPHDRIYKYENEYFFGFDTQAIYLPSEWAVNATPYVESASQNKEKVRKNRWLLNFASLGILDAESASLSDSDKPEDLTFMFEGIFDLLCMYSLKMEVKERDIRYVKGEIFYACYDRQNKNKTSQKNEDGEIIPKSAENNWLWEFVFSLGKNEKHSYAAVYAFTEVMLKQKDELLSKIQQILDDLDDETSDLFLAMKKWSLSKKKKTMVMAFGDIIRPCVEILQDDDLATLAEQSSRPDEYDELSEMIAPESELTYQVPGEGERKETRDDDSDPEDKDFGEAESEGEESEGESEGEESEGEGEGEQEGKEEDLSAEVPENTEQIIYGTIQSKGRARWGGMLQLLDSKYVNHHPQKLQLKVECEGVEKSNCQFPDRIEYESKITRAQEEEYVAELKRRLAETSKIEQDEKKRKQKKQPRIPTPDPRLKKLLPQTRK